MCSMKDDRKRILEMVKSGLLTIDEAEKLLDELDKAEKMTEESKANDVPAFIIESEKQNSSTDNTFEYKYTKEKSLKDKFLDLFDTAVQKVKELDLDFHHSVKVSHVFQQNNTDFQDILIEIPNGSVVLNGWDHSDVRIECEAKVFRTENQTEGKERFLRDVLFEVENNTLSFISKDKINKVDVRIYVPKKDYEKIYVKLFNGPITGEYLNGRTLSFQTTVGQVRLASSEGEQAKIETANGVVTITDNKYEKVETETVNGKVSIDGIYKKIEAETISGAITTYLKEPQPETVRLSSATGTINVKVPRGMPISGEVKSNLGNVQVDLENLYQVNEEKEMVQKSITFDTTADLQNKTYLFADAKTGTVFVQPY